MGGSDTSRIGLPFRVRLEDQGLLSELGRADLLDSQGAGSSEIRDHLEKTFRSAVDQYGLFHAIPMQVLIHVVDRWVGCQNSIGHFILADVLKQVKQVWRRASSGIQFNDNVCNVLLRLSEACARADLEEEGLQFIALNEWLVESWRGLNHPDYAGAIYNQGRYFHLLGRNSEAQTEFLRALSVEGLEDLPDIRGYIQGALDRLMEGSTVNHFGDPEILRPWFCLLESSLPVQRRQAAKQVLEICRENPHLHVREDHEGVGKAKADSDSDVWQPVALARLHLANSPAHHAAALVLEAQRTDPDEVLRDRAMELLSMIPVGKMGAGLFSDFASHISDSLLSTHLDVAIDSARCLYELAGWEVLPVSVVENVTKQLSTGTAEMREKMMGVLYSAAQYGDTDLSPAVESLQNVHQSYPELRPQPGRTLCRHYERITGMKYIQDPQLELNLPSHWRVESTRLPLYGVVDCRVDLPFEELGRCSNCGNTEPHCIYFSRKGASIGEIYCPQCDLCTNFRSHPEPGYY